MRSGGLRLNQPARSAQSAASWQLKSTDAIARNYCTLAAKTALQYQRVIISTISAWGLALQLLNNIHTLPLMATYCLQ
jgi:hypothetical protein